MRGFKVRVRIVCMIVSEDSLLSSAFLIVSFTMTLVFYRLSTQHVRVFCITVLWFLNFERKRSFLRDFREMMYLFTWKSFPNSAAEALYVT